MAGSWIQCSFDVEGRHINDSVKPFNHDERHLMAAEVAWFTPVVLTSAESHAVGLDVDA